MRPESLFPYFTDIESLPGIGKRNRQAMERAAGSRYLDLLFHLPVGVTDRQYRPTAAEAVAGSVATMTLEVVKHSPSPNRRVPYKVLMRDETGFLTLVFFNARADWLGKQLPEGEARIISGKLEDFQGSLQITHPDYMVPIDKAGEIPAFETLYGLSVGLSLKVLRKAIGGALDAAPDLPEWLRPDLLTRENWPAFKTALETVHRPKTIQDIRPETPARRRLAYDELLSTQLALAIVREHTRARRGRSIKASGDKRAALLSILPYSLTGDQEKALSDILADMQDSKAMMRLVQGDVGSGKTIVALMAMAEACEAGVQSALLAPTEILAKQHYHTIKPLAERIGIRAALLTGKMSKADRMDVLTGLDTGEIPIVIGTHAIIQKDVEFQDLGLAIIDEQHRFGVAQRLALTDKGTSGVDTIGNDSNPHSPHVNDDSVRGYGCVAHYGKTTGPATNRHTCCIAEPVA